MGAIDIEGLTETINANYKTKMIKMKLKKAKMTIGQI